MRFIMITTGWVFALLLACILHSCSGSRGVEDRAGASFLEKIGDVTVVCLYGIRYGLGVGEQALIPLMGQDGWPLPCKDRTPETCEKKLLACQVDCLADQTTMRELEECDGLNAFVERCIGGEKRAVPSNPYTK